MVVSGELKLPNDRVKRRGSEADSAFKAILIHTIPAFPLL
jgi:hypothetical protein